MTVFRSPAVTSRERKAFVGIGLGLGEGDGEGDADGEAVGDGDVDGVGVSAVSNNQMGTMTRTRSKRMKRGNDTRGWLVTPAATGSTMRTSVLGSAKEVRGNHGGDAAGRAAPPG